jgi:hypothetical protein
MATLHVLLLLLRWLLCRWILNIPTSSCSSHSRGLAAWHTWRRGCELLLLQLLLMCGRCSHCITLHVCWQWCWLQLLHMLLLDMLHMLHLLLLLQLRRCSCCRNITLHV